MSPIRQTSLPSDNPTLRQQREGVGGECFDLQLEHLGVALLAHRTVEVTVQDTFNNGGEAPV